MEEYLIFFALVLGVNMLPAFGPPTWSIIALYAFNSDLSLAALVGTGALAAASATSISSNARAQKYACIVAKVAETCEL